MKIPTTYGLSKDVITFIEEGAAALEISKSAYAERVILEYINIKNSLKSVDMSTFKIEAQPLPNNNEPDKDQMGDAIASSIADIFKNMH